jgi:hypothetical protein
MMTTKETDMTTFKDVLAFVTLEATHDQLVAISEASKFRRENISKTVKYTIKAGQNVVFTHKGINYSGVVKSIKIKNAVVECLVPNARAYNAKMQQVPATTRYNVPLNMLKAA